MTWTTEKVKRHFKYRQYDPMSNPLYSMWLEVRSRSCRAWKRSYIQFATDVLNVLGEPSGSGIVRVDDSRCFSPINIKWGNLMSRMALRKRGRPRTNEYEPNALTMQSPMFRDDRRNYDGTWTIAGRNFANDYQYRLYNRYKKGKKKDGTAYIEFVDFYLNEQGYVVRGSI